MENRTISFSNNAASPVQIKCLYNFVSKKAILQEKKFTKIVKYLKKQRR